MIYRLNALRAERASAACTLQALGSSEAGQLFAAPDRENRIDTLMRTIDRLDNAIAQWDDPELRLA